MPKITILCGESPLPVCQALKTLTAHEVVIIDEVVIVHGQDGSKKVADRVKDYCIATLNIDASKVQLVEVDALNPIKCQLELQKKKELFQNSTLVYGPGTSVMNAMIHEVWRSAGGNELDKGQSWYVQANPSQLLPSSNGPLEKDDKGEVLESEKQKKVVATGLGSKGLIKLHLQGEFTVKLPDESASPPPENMDPFATWKEADIIKAKSDIGQGVVNILYKGRNHAKYLSDEGKKWLWNFDRKFRDGFFMEAVIFHVLKQEFSPDQILHSVEILDKYENSVLEMDVLLRKGDNLLWISSHTNLANNKWDKDKNRLEENNPYTEFRKKFFEAKENAVRLSGKEARSITIVNRSIQRIPRSETVEIAYKFKDRINNGEKLRRKLNLLRPDENGDEKEYSNSDRHIIVDLAELLGQNPMETVSGAKKLSESATTTLYSWIHHALNH
jgi:hypothetical protein